MPVPHASPARRLDIQLLRGLAVFAVFLAHFGAIMPGGFLGVDVFFVISGFVITMSLYSKASPTTPTRLVLRDFWKARFFRLVPALSLVVASTLVLAVVSLPPRQFNDQVEMSLWSLLFAGNIGVEVVTRGDYFDPGAKENWLLHLWSLGVEEQFYLVFPIVFLAALALARRKSSSLALVSVVISALALVSFTAAVLNDVESRLGLTGVFTESTGLAALFGYYSPLTRAWQFALGAIAFLASTKRLQSSPQWPGWVALIGLLGSFIWIQPSNLLPGFPTLVPTVALVILLLFPLRLGGWPGVLVTPLRWLGDRSYSAYLWHWPIWLFLETHIEQRWLQVGLAFAFTLFLSTATYQFIEKPFIARYKTPTVSGKSRSNSFFQPGVMLTPLLIAPLVLGAGVQWLYSTLQDRGALREAPSVPRVSDSLDCLKSDCSGEIIEVLLVGDSHAGALGTALHKEFQRHGIDMRATIVARHSGCLHLPSTSITSAETECQDLSTQVREVVITSKPALVLIHGYTAGRFTEINSGGDAEIQLVNNITGETITAASAPAAYRQSLGETVEFLRKQGAQVKIISGVPDFSLRPEDVGVDGQPASQFELFVAPLFDLGFGQTVSREVFDGRHGVFRDIEKDIVNRSPGAEWIDPWPSLCKPESCSQTLGENVFLYADQDHLSPLGAEMLARDVVGLVLRDE